MRSEANRQQRPIMEVAVAFARRLAQKAGARQTRKQTARAREDRRQQEKLSAQELDARLDAEIERVGTVRISLADAVVIL